MLTDEAIEDDDGDEEEEEVEDDDEDLERFDADNSNDSDSDSSKDTEEFRAGWISVEDGVDCAAAMRSGCCRF